MSNPHRLLYCKSRKHMFVVFCFWLQNWICHVFHVFCIICTANEDQLKGLGLGWVPAYFLHILKVTKYLLPLKHWGMALSVEPWRCIVNITTHGYSTLKYFIPPRCVCHQNLQYCESTLEFPSELLACDWAPDPDCRFSILSCGW